MKIKYLIDTLLSPQISVLPWVGRYGGIVNTIYRQQKGKGDSFITKKFPVASDITNQDCTSLSIDHDLVPNDQYNSVVYWEEVTPMQNIGETKTKKFTEKRFRGTARLVCWVNKAKLGIDPNTTLINAVAELEAIISTRGKITGGTFNNSQIKIEPKGAVKHDIKTIFGKYDYDELKNYYLYPFDYFAIDFTFTLDQCLASTAALIPGTPEDCPNEVVQPACPDITPTAHSMVFDGVNENIEYGTDAAFDFQTASSYTLSGWMKFNSFNNGHTISKYDTATTTGTYVSAGAGNRIRFDLQKNAGGGLGIISVRTPLLGLVTGQWYHVAVTYNGNGLASGTEMYVDGVQQTKSVLFDTLGGGNISNAQNLKLGGDNTSGLYLNGSLYEVRIWNTVLTPSQVLLESTLNPTTGLAPTPIQPANLITRNQTSGGNEAIFGSSEWNFANNSTITTAATSNNMEEGDSSNDLP